MPAPWSLPPASRSMVPNVDFFALRVGQKIEVVRHSSSSHALLQHPAPVPCVIGVDRRVWLARAPCAYRKSHPAILMVQSAQDLAADDIPGPLNAARKRGILVQ